MVIVNVIGKDMEKNCEANYLIALSQDFFRSQGQEERKQISERSICWAKRTVNCADVKLSYTSVI